MLSLLFKFFIYSNILFSILILVYLIFSKSKEPKEFPDFFSKKYTLKSKIKT